MQSRKARRVVTEREPDDKTSTDDRSADPPVDGPGAAEGNDESGGTSYDRPGGEHGADDGKSRNP